MIEDQTPKPTPARHPGHPGNPSTASPAAEILIVGDRVPIVESLAAALSGPGLAVGTMVEPVMDGTPPAPSEPGRGVAVLDAGLGAPGEGPALARSLSGAGWPVLVLAAPGDPLATAACLEAGAVAHLPVHATLGEVAAAVEDVREGREVRVGPGREELLALLREARTTSARLLRPFDRLTRREREVLGGLIDGMRAEEIAAADFVSPTTVRNQIQSVLTKLGVSTRLEAVALARRSGWPPESDA